MDQYYAQSPDGKEFGPTDLAGLQQWVREGRVLPSTRIRKNDGAAIAAEFIAELSTMFGGPTVATPPPIATTVPLPEQFGAWRFIGQAWDLVRPHWLVLGLMALIMSAIGIVPVIGACASLLLSGVFMVGFYRALLGILAGRAPTVEMLFGGFDRFGQALLATIVVGILVALGVVLLIVPGIILAIMWMFVSVILADTDLDFADAMRASSTLTRGYRWHLFGLALASLVVLFAGALACGIGIFVAQPVVFMSIALAYRFLQRQQAQRPSV